MASEPRRRARAFLLLALGCGTESPLPPASLEPGTRFLLVDATVEAGLAFRHRHGGTGRRYMPETMGSGLAWLDYDGDGWVDLYLVNAEPTPGYEGPPIADALYRNLGDGSFADVTTRSRAEHPGYGMGAAVADLEGDGDLDLYVSNFGQDALLRNDGDGTFTEVTQASGIGDPWWSMSAAFGDLDGDGDPDLYTTNYVDFTYATHKICGDARLGFEAYCHPDVYAGVPDSLFFNRGDGTFERASEDRLPKHAAEWALAGKGLGVGLVDFDDDRDLDIFVANDSTPNFLWANRGDGTFVDQAPILGIAFDEDGESEACMGVAVGDADEDGDAEIFVTNLDFETNTLYANQEGLFVGRTATSGLGPPSWLMVGFGTEFVDLDNDGRLDLVVVNGHIIDNIHLQRPDVSYAQPTHVFLNEGELRFRDVSRGVGDAVTRPSVSRGLALADYDLDGDVDLAVSRNNESATLLRNDGGNTKAWLELRLVGAGRGRDGFGARAVLETAGRRLHRELRSGGSYLSQSEGLLHFGLDDVQGIDRLEVSWPSGRRQALLGPPPGKRLVLPEGPRGPATGP